MTLDTHVVIKNPDVHPEVVLEFINRELLRAKDPIRAPWPSPHLSPETTAEWWPGERHIGNLLGQGLFAIAQIMVCDPVGPITATYGTGWNADGTLNEADAEDRREYDPDWQPVDKALVTGSMVISFDTGYGFEVAGAGCGDLHAWFVVRLAEEYGPVVWQDEGSGNWYPLDGKDVRQVYALADHLGDPGKGQAAVETRGRLCLPTA
jgi:hypothetical protein